MTFDPSTITLAELAPYVDHTTALGVEIAVQKLRCARLEEQLADAHARASRLESEADRFIHVPIEGDEVT